MEPRQARNLLKLDDFQSLLNWIEYKAEVYKEIGFKEMDEQKRLIYLGNYEALKGLVASIHFWSKQKEKKLDTDLEI